MFVDAAGELASHSRTPYPSGVSWSADGQFLVLTHAYLHILSPSLGLCLREDRAALSGLPGNKLQEQWSADKSSDDFQAGECVGLPIFKTSIAAHKRKVEWEEYTTDSRLTTAGALDNGWRMASWSPSSMSNLGRCILATLDTNREVAIYSSESDAIRSNWEEIFDLTAAYIAHLQDVHPELLDKRPEDTPETLQAKHNQFVIKGQATSVAWSHPGQDHAVRDDSLLAVAFTSGCLTLWRYLPEGTMKLVFEQKVSAEWPVVASWSSWRGSGETGRLSSHLALSGTSETVILEVSQEVEGEITCTTLHTTKTTGRTVTALKWLDDDRLLIGRLGELTVWSASATQTLPIPIEDFRGWTSLSHPLDIVSTSTKQRHVLALGDGTLRSIDGLRSDAPTLHPLGKGRGPSNALSEDLRDAFMSIERAVGKGIPKATISSTSAMILGGMLPIDNDGTIFFSYEKHQLDRKLYQMANLHKFQFALTHFKETGVARSTEDRIRALMVHGSDKGAAISSSRTLLPLLLALRNAAAQRDSLASAHAAIVDTLDLQNTTTPLTEGSASAGHVASALSSIDLQRLRYAGLLIRFIESVSKDDTVAADCRTSAQKVFVAIYATVYGLLKAYLSTCDIPPSALMTRYTRLAELLAEVRRSKEGIDSAGVPGIAESLPSAVDQTDSCAACGQTINFDVLGKATCASGHNWIRCCITLQVMSTAAARTCSSCGRKSQIPKASAEAQGQAEDAGQKLLKLANYCLFCGGRWNC